MSELVLLCDDDTLTTATLASALRDAGYRVTQTTSVEECLSVARSTRHDLALIDVMMPPGPLQSAETHGGYATGIALARELRRIQPDLKIAGMSNAPTRELVEWFRRHANGFFPKRDAFANADLFARWATRLLAPAEWWSTIHTCIVHGHDHGTLRSLERYLIETLRLPPPTILGDLASGGQTLIEKLEDVGSAVDVVFVLMTPDDVVTTSTGVSGRQARPNVLLEAGYFLGLLSRRSGRVILLSTGQTMLPSDLLGVGFVDVSHGIAAAGDDIRRELQAWSQR
jgi:CheY-like chemotaxis protein